MPHVPDQGGGAFETSVVVRIEGRYPPSFLTVLNALVYFYTAPFWFDPSNMYSVVELVTRFLTGLIIHLFTHYLSLVGQKPKTSPCY